MTLFPQKRGVEKEPTGPILIQQSTRVFANRSSNGQRYAGAGIAILIHIIAGKSRCELVALFDCFVSDAGSLVHWRVEIEPVIARKCIDVSNMVADRGFHETGIMNQNISVFMHVGTAHATVVWLTGPVDNKSIIITSQTNHTVVYCGQGQMCVHTCTGSNMLTVGCTEC